MNKKEIDKFCREYYGFTLEDADGSIGYWMGKYQELEQENKELHNKIDKAIEYMNGEEFFLLMNSVQTPDKAVCEDYFKAKGNLLKILKDSDVDE